MLSVGREVWEDLPGKGGTVTTGCLASPVPYRQLIQRKTRPSFQSPSRGLKDLLFLHTAASGGSGEAVPTFPTPSSQLTLHSGHVLHFLQTPPEPVSSLAHLSPSASPTSRMQDGVLLPTPAVISHVAALPVRPSAGPARPPHCQAPTRPSPSPPGQKPVADSK